MMYLYAKVLWGQNVLTGTNVINLSLSVVQYVHTALDILDIKIKMKNAESFANSWKKMEFANTTIVQELATLQNKEPRRESSKCIFLFLNEC